MSLIDREELYGMEKLLAMSAHGIESKTLMDQVLYDIENVPTIDAEPVRHGRWIDKKRWSMGKWHKWLECSECKYQDYGLETYEAIPFTGPANYCPNCGAKMDAEEDVNAKS